MLILDEPTAEFGPEGDDILRELKRIFDKRMISLQLSLVSHSMEDIAKLAQRVIVMHAGQVFADDVPRKVYSRDIELEEIGLDVPQVTKAARALEGSKVIKFDDIVITVRKLFENLKKLGGEKNA